MKDAPTPPAQGESIAPRRALRRLRDSAGPLLALARSELRLLIPATIFLVVGSAMGLAWPQAIRVIIDEAIAGDNRARIDLAALVMVGLFLVQGVATALRYLLFTIAGERIVARLRGDLFARVIAQEIAFFDGRRTGELLNRLASDTSVLQNTVTANISMALRALLQSVGALALLFYTSPGLTLLMLVVVPPVAVAAVAFGRFVRRLSRDVQDALAEASEVAEESIGGIRTVRFFHREAFEAARYRSAVDHSFGLARRRAQITALFTGVASIAGYGAVALVLWRGGRLVLDDAMSVGDLTSFVLYTLVVAFSLGTLAGLYADFMRAAGAAERVFDLMDRMPAMGEATGARPEVSEGALAFDNVAFSYPSRPDLPVLRGLSFTLEPGRSLALVGPSGAGKSTVAALCARLYDVHEGRITWDGQDIRSLDPGWLRSRIAVVAQEPLLFSTTIGENIRYGRETASEEELRAAARAANAEEFILAFPMGYDTPVGERGVQLSGGQKQRVAIARAILRDPDLLILDEATSALDTQSETLVQEALETLMEGRTVLIIAHRLSTVRRADAVIVLEAGRVVEQGTHDTLVERGGLYARLYRGGMPV